LSLKSLGNTTKVLFIACKSERERGREGEREGEKRERKVVFGMKIK
jgi:hypothetical protein